MSANCIHKRINGEQVYCRSNNLTGTPGPVPNWYCNVCIYRNRPLYRKPWNWGDWLERLLLRSGLKVRYLRLRARLTKTPCGCPHRRKQLNRFSAFVQKVTRELLKLR